MLLSELIAIFEDIAPTRLAESWDNVGLIAGNPGQTVSKVMLTIDYTPDVAREAAGQGVDCVVAYHPPLFSAVKRLVAPDVIYDAIRRGVAIYSPHTALDVADGGTNDLLADVLGLEGRQPLRLVETKAREYKLVTFVPEKDLEKVAQALFAAGAGRIGHYTHCSFRTPGTGTFMGDQTTNPAVGEKGVYERTAEVRVETVCPIGRLAEVLAALRASHPYEEPAFDLVQLAAPPEKVGQGRIGDLPSAASVPALLKRIKEGLALSHLLVAGPTDQTVNRASVLAGAGREHLKDAICQGAQLYLTGEVPHHDALSAAKAGVTVVCTHEPAGQGWGLVGLRGSNAARSRQVEFLGW
jgi:dinuclear metal center YbgI/SA1388 family protein